MARQLREFGVVFSHPALSLDLVRARTKCEEVRVIARCAMRLVHLRSTIHCATRVATILLCAPRPELLEADSLSLAFSTPIMRLQLNNVLPEGTLEALGDAVMGSWLEYRSGSEDGNALTGQQRNEDFFYFQKEEYGTTKHHSDPNPEGWLASSAAQSLLELSAACIAGYLEQIATHSGSSMDGSLEIDPDDLHAWASVHQGGSNHGRHIHYGAAVSAVFYVRAPPGAGRICFFDPRGEVPPFERSICYAPQPGDLLLFPPWLSHAVASTGSGESDPDSGARVSISVNLVNEDLEGGRHGWGSATAGLESVVIEGDLGLEQRDGEGEVEVEGSGSQVGAEGLTPEALEEGLMRVRAALAAAGREGQEPSELISVLKLVAAESAVLAEQIEAGDAS